MILLLTLLTGCDDCFTYSLCEDGSPLEACSNELKGECWYQAGDARFDCDGCDCDQASLDALAECQPGDTG